MRRHPLHQHRRRARPDDIVAVVPEGEESAPMAFTLNSPSFQHGAEIPTKHTCEGDDLAPALSWTDAPGATKSFVLIVDDPDAPDPRAPQRPWVHWLLYNLPPSTTSLPEGAVSADLPFGALEGVNDWHRIGYGGPCPPVGRHRYFHKLYALDDELPLTLGRATRADLENAMRGHVLAEAELMGTYEKQGAGVKP